LVEAVKAKTELDVPRDDGTSLRKQLEQVEKQNGHRDPRLDAVDVPPEVNYLWLFFWEIKIGVASSGFGPATITHTDLQAWMQNTETYLNLWEQQTVWAMNNAYLEVIIERDKKKSQQLKQRQQSAIRR
jgi:hypothetical protein